MSGIHPPVGRARQTRAVEAESQKPLLAEELDGGPPWREALARLVDADAGRDEAENDYYETANDPQFRAKETAQRRFKSQLRRRLRHRESKARERAAE